MSSAGSVRDSIVIEAPATGVVEPALGFDGFDALGGRLEQGLDLLCASVLERHRERLADRGLRSPPVGGELAALTREALAAELRGFRAEALPERCPDFLTALAAAAVDAGEPDLFLRGHRIIHKVLWGAWFEIVEGSRGLDFRCRLVLLRRGSDYFFAYADLLGDHVTDIHRRRLQQADHGSRQRRSRAIRDFLDGDDAAPAPDFDLDRHHLGLISWGEEPEAAVRALAKDLARPLLSVSPPQGGRCCWAWISGTRPLGGAEQRTLAAFRPDSAGVALGLEGFGAAGFRATHSQALRARRFANRPGPGVTRYEDVVVESLAVANEEDAIAFVAHELRGIGDDTATSQRIRETLAAYFAAECNAASAGAVLGVHQQTVANRLRSAEQRLGRDSIGARRVELELALRLRERLALG